MSHFQIEIILWSRLDIPVNNKNDNKEHMTQSKLLLPYVYMIVLLVSAKSHSCMCKCIPPAQSCLNYLYNIEHDNEIVVLIGEIKRG